MAEVIWTLEAIRWLRAIHEHIAADSVAAADRVVEAILSRADQLTAFPQSGTPVSVAGLDDIRMLRYQHYRIVCRECGALVEILGVYHGSLDIARHLAMGSEPDVVND